jgi:N-acetylneuraminic acid mutarotase
MKMIIFCQLLAILSVTCFNHAKAQESGHWELLKTNNTAEGRSECGLASVDGKLYLLGGDGPVMAVEVFDPATSTWSKKAVGPVVMHHFQAVSLGKKVYVLDAFYHGSFPNQDPAPNAYSYDTETDSWQQLAGLPADRRRAGAGAAEYRGKLYLVAGIKHGHSSGTNNLFDEYDPKANTWTALPDAPHIRDHSMAVVIGDKLYAVGGRNTSLHDPDNFMSFFDKVVLDVDCFDFKTGKWSTLDAKLPLGTGGGTAVNLDGKLFYVGGERATATTRNSSQKDVYYLDVKHPDKWVEAARLNKARNGVGGAVLNHKIYIAGGSGGGPGGPPPNGQMPGGPPPNQQPGNPPQSPLPGSGPPGQRSEIVIEEFSFK